MMKYLPGRKQTESILGKGSSVKQAVRYEIAWHIEGKGREEMRLERQWRRQLAKKKAKKASEGQIVQFS
jgi:hypothetical protein